MAAKLNIVECIRECVTPADCALVQGGRRMSYGELLAETDALARRLRDDFKDAARKARPRVGVQFPSGLNYIPLALATLEAGFCFVPIPEELADPEKADLVKRTALDGMLVAGGHASWAPEDSQCLNEFLYQGVSVAVYRMANPRPLFPEESFESLNPAFIRFSSGTTGRSKGVVLSHESLLQRIRAANQGLRIGSGDRILWVLPMAHHFAVSIILYLYHGAVTIIEDQHLSEDLLRAGSEHQATVMYGSPFHYRQLVDAPGSKDWSSLRLAVSTAAALDAGTAGKFRKRFGSDLVQGLGIIEVGLPLLNLDGAEAAPEAIGKPLPGFECLLRDEDDSRVGELCLRGPGMFDAYLDPWQPRGDVADTEGWFATGDLAQRDTEGRIFLRGRTKSVINVGGMKVFPEEVERVLDAHPKVKRALVEARAHPLFGEAPVARYVPGDPPPTVSELRSHCREHLAGYKIPLIFTSVAALPTTASGKLLRNHSKRQDGDD